MSQMAKSARVHPSAVLDGDVQLGDDVVIDAFCYIEGPARIGARTHVYPGCVIGCPPEHKTHPPAGAIVIGADAIIRELNVIQRGTGDRDTTIGDRCYVMAKCHVAHDVQLGDDCTLSPHVVLGGHTRVLEGATLGLGVLVHQFSTIGGYVMAGMGAVVTRDVPPLALIVGSPARFVRFNTHQFARLGVTADDVSAADGRLTSKSARVIALADAFAAERRANRELLRLD